MNIRAGSIPSSSGKTRKRRTSQRDSNGSLVPKTPMSSQPKAITHSSKNAERRMEQENARTLRVNSGSERGKREKGNKGHDKSHESRLRSFEEGHRGRRDGETEKERRSSRLSCVRI